MEIDVNYKSVHDYMDALFKDMNPTDDEIRQAKEAYRKLYQKYYRESYKKSHVQITFRVSKDQYRELTALAKEQGIKVTSLVKQRALEANNSKNISVKIQLSELLDIIEQSIYQDKELSITEILKQLESIEKKL